MASVTLVAGLGFGDEGKGTVVDYLARRHKSALVVRYNGGAQAGHHVVLLDGTRHTFSQWGAGTFAGAATFLSRFMVVDPVSAFSEAKALEAADVPRPLERLYVDLDALVTTPFHMAMNRLREITRGDGRHGSCGMGVGEAMADAATVQDDVIYARTLVSGSLRHRLQWCQERKLREVERTWGLSGWPDAAVPELDVLRDPGAVEVVAERFRQFQAAVRMVDGEAFLREELVGDGHILFEGAQGVLLDEWRGFHPHTTWSTCTFDNALELVGGRADSVRRLGVFRTYHTRHGAGPFPTAGSLGGVWVQGDHNRHNRWQESFRAGAFDTVLAQYALAAIGGVDGIALTHVDRFMAYAEAPICVRYEGSAPLMVGAKGDLQHQEQLGRLLAAATPVYRFLDPCDLAPAAPVPSATDIARLFTNVLGVPVSLVSTGPTWKHKREL